LQVSIESVLNRSESVLNRIDIGVSIESNRFSIESVNRISQVRLNQVECLLGFEVFPAMADSRPSREPVLNLPDGERLIDGEPVVKRRRRRMAEVERTGVVSQISDATMLACQTAARYMWADNVVSISKYNRVQVYNGSDGASFHIRMRFEEPIATAQTQTLDLDAVTPTVTPTLGADAPTVAATLPLAPTSTSSASLSVLEPVVARVGPSCTQTLPEGGTDSQPCTLDYGWTR
jgi:hypothetical protein